MAPIIEDTYRQLFGRGGTRKGTDISMSEHGRSGGVSTGQGFKFTDMVNYAIKMTESGTDTYIAYANPGTLESDAKWRVMKIDTSSGMRITWADGDSDYDNIATDLTTLDYS